MSNDSMGYSEEPPSFHRRRLVSLRHSLSLLIAPAHNSNKVTALVGFLLNSKRLFNDVPLGEQR